MRFVRAYYRAGVCVAVAEQETPFTMPAVLDADEVEVGLVEDFDPQGAAPSKRLFECMSQGTPLPAAVIDCPTSLDGIRQRVRERGPQAVPTKARAWLTYMVPEDAKQMNLHRGIPVSALKALDDMRVRRDPHVGSRRVNFERAVQETKNAEGKSGAAARKAKDAAA